MTANAELSGTPWRVRLDAVLDAGDCGQRGGERSRDAGALDLLIAEHLKIAKRWPKRMRTLQPRCN